MTNTYQAPRKSKLVAGLLALFLGGLGIHKFYLNQGGTGMLMLIFFWTFIPAFVSFFQAINYFTMSDKKFDEIYND
jgi:TM2 domain-containing membrane protein YozV